jgi:hypothetical protein
MVQQNVQNQTPKTKLYQRQNQLEKTPQDKKTTTNAIRYKINQEMKFLYCKQLYV